MRSIITRGLLLAATAASLAAEAPAGGAEREPSAALASDDECLAAEGGEGCALSAVQLRGLQVHRALGSCKSLGCNGAYHKGSDCQCTANCGKHGNCCGDYQATCAAGAQASPAAAAAPPPPPAVTSNGLTFRPVPADCKAFGCGGAGAAAVPGRPCQCSEDCGVKGNCCADYTATCAGKGGRPRFLSMVPYARSGVNFGGWFVLEDWFFSGNAGNHVMSMSDAQGICLPPLLKNSGEKWPSEGILVHRLVASKGPEETIKIFEAHRDTYITDQDFAEAAKMGMTKVRLPIPWYAFADALAPLDPKVYAPGAKIVPDPFYSSEASFVTLDRARLGKVLDMAAAHGIKVILDIHNSPGGAQDGTYNGVWPLKPAFWMENTKVGKPTPLTETGLWIAAALIKWVETLEGARFDAVEGVTLMNEPAHMANIDAAKGAGFIRSEQEVWDWIAKSSDLFRTSSLPKRGKRLYVSLVETTWNDAYNQMPIHWGKMFSATERHTWAVFDVHWYIAWSGDLCSGRTTAGGQFKCDMSVEELRPLLRNCAVHDMVRFFKQVDGLKACSEWSLGTFEQPQQACQNTALLQAFFEEQLDVYKMYGIEPFFWTWNLPYGKNFQSAWSFKFVAGQEAPTPAGVCE